VRTAGSAASSPQASREPSPRGRAAGAASQQRFARRLLFTSIGHAGGVRAAASVDRTGEVARGERFAAWASSVSSRLPFGLGRWFGGQVVGFCVLNLCTFAFDLLLLTSLHGVLGWRLWVSITCSYATALLLSYALNRALNFRSHAPVGPQLVVYAAVVGANYVVCILGVGDGLAALGLDYRIARACAGLCEAVWIFTAMRRLVFRDSRCARPPLDTSRS